MAKIKVLISFAVTTKLICVFVLAYADCWFSQEAAQMSDEVFACCIQRHFKDQYCSSKTCTCTILVISLT